MVDPVLTESSDQIKQCQRCGTQYPVTHASDICDVDDGQLILTNADTLFGSVVAGRYTLCAPIGVGGWSSVYLAEDRQLKRPVAVKILHQFLRRDEGITKRFQREAVIAASLSHPNITTMFDFGLLPNGQPYIVMEYLKGFSLDHVVSSERQLPRLRAIAIMGQICEALDHAHKCGLIHRDLKPGNVFLLESDFVKVLDFGLAKSGGQVESLTTTGTAVGTPLFMSPEQCQGGAVDQRSDIYALGLMMHFMLTGEPAFHAETLFEAVHKHILEVPKSLSECRPDLIFPAGLDEAVLRCLKKDPAERFENCLEFKSAINAQFAHYSAEKKHITKEVSTKESSATASETAGYTFMKMLPSLAALLLVIVGLASALIIGINRHIGPRPKIGPQSVAQQTVVPQPGRHEDHIPIKVEHLKAYNSTAATNAERQNEKPASAESLPLMVVPTVRKADAKSSTIPDAKLTKRQGATTTDTHSPDSLGHNSPEALATDTRAKHGHDRPSTPGEAATKETKARPKAPAADIPKTDVAQPGEMRPAPGRDTQDSVAISGLKSDDEAIARLSAVSDCRQLHITNSTISDRILKYAIDNFPSLRLVNFSNTQVDDRGLELIAKSNLVTVNLSGTLVTDNGLAGLRARRLAHLILARDKITDAGVQSISSVPLTILILAGTGITDHCGESLGKMVTLHALSLANTPISDGTVAQLASLHHLVALNLLDTNVTDACAQYLAQMPALEELSLGDTQITDAGLERLSACKHLKRLELQRTNITVEGVSYLTKMSALQAVRLPVRILLQPDVRNAFQKAGVRLIRPSEKAFTIPFMHPR